MANKPSTKLLLLCAAAVGAIYSGAYVYTEPNARAVGTPAAGALASGGVGRQQPSSASPTNSSKAPSSAPQAPAASSRASSSGSTSSGPGPLTRGTKGTGVVRGDHRHDDRRHYGDDRHRDGRHREFGDDRRQTAGRASSPTPSTFGGNATKTPAGSASSSSSAGGPTSSAPSSTAPAPSKSAQKATPSSTAVYKDGTYVGSGANAYGRLSVAVSISAGKIAAVQITSYQMHYPQYYVSPLMNNEFVKMQTYRVYAVSGATASSDNFAQAVYNALLKAKA